MGNTITQLCYQPSRRRSNGFRNRNTLYTGTVQFQAIVQEVDFSDSGLEFMDGMVATYIVANMPKDWGYG